MGSFTRLPIHKETANVLLNRGYYMEYRIAGNFCGVLIFVVFMTDVAVTKFRTPRKFAIVGKGHQVKSRHACANNCDRMHGSISGISVLLTVSDFQTKD